MQSTTESQTNRAIELDDKIRLQETLWSGGLIPTGMLVEDITELIGILKNLEESADPKKPLTNYIDKMKRKLTKYQEVMKEEESQDV